MRKKAVSLKYDRQKDIAPRVTAKGEGVIAQKIIELAKEYDIPIKEDKDLVEMLSKIELNDQIPPELYKAVAEVLSFIYKNVK